MKILKVEFENINSLAGEWCIDFTDSSYSELDHSLFVISGKTGMGKTSILDAITLGLYGRTPRQEKVGFGNNGNVVMTSGKASCYARVTYRCQKGTFVSEWSQRRARDRADGNLQNAHGRIYALDNPGVFLFDGNTGANGDLGEKNAEIIQLDYSQFCRSIMLAQGEFSKFLLSNEEDRAKILEKLNGAERYRRIAQKVGDRNSDANKARSDAQTAYNTLNESMPKAEDIAKDEALLAETAEKEKGFRSKLGDLDSRIAWRKSMDEAVANLRLANETLKKADDAKKAFAESETRLENAEKALTCASLFTELQGFRKNKASAEADLGKLQERLPKATDLLKETAEAERLAREELSAADRFIGENEAVWNEIRKLDERVKGAESVKAEAENRKNKAAEALSDAKSSLKKAKDEILDLEPQVENLRKIQEANAKDASLKEIVSQSEIHIVTIRKLNNEIAAEERAKDAAGKSYARAEEDFQKDNARKQDLLKEQQDLFKNDVLVLANVIQKHLTDGEPCPVCGSKEHPACTHVGEEQVDESRAVSVAEKIRDLNTRIQDVELAIGREERAKNRVKDAENAALERIDSLTVQVKETVDTVGGLWKPWAEFDIESADSVLENLKKRMQQFLSNQENYETLSNKLALARNSVAGLETGAQKAKDALDVEEEAFKKAEDSLSGLRNERKEKFGDMDVEAVAKAAMERKAKGTEAHKVAEDKFRKAESACNELNTKMGSLKDSITRTETDLASALEKFNDAIEAKGFADEKAYQAASLPEAEIKSLQVQKKSVDDALVTAKTKQQTAVEVHEKLKLERSDKTARQVLETERNKVNADLDALLQTTGAARARVDLYKKSSARLLELQKDLEVKSAECARWNTMAEWFGKRDGSAFATFVQGLTFKSLLKLANKHLEIVKDRFRLVAEGDLGFKIEDVEFDEPRRVTNLSGGEKFLVSLSLALGIADFASRNVRVESLFMDEGFGTLDEATLNDVMDCLRRQQRSGKMLGIITHVESVVKSINQKIMLEPDKHGYSKITGPGVTRVA